MRMLGKKAMTPLAATFLLVVFALAIGAVIMSFGQGYVEEINYAEASEQQEESTSIIINPATIKDPLKKLQLQYLTDAISKEEYLEKENEILGK